MTDAALAARNIGAKLARRALNVHKPAVRMARRIGRVREQLQYRREELRIERQIAAVARGTAPIIAGPWLGEVGYEALYWVPFLRWFEDAHRVAPERVIALSRGGVDAWYSRVATCYVDLFDFFSQEEFGGRNEERRNLSEAGGHKHSGQSDFDRDILTRVQRHLDLPDVHVLHPSLFFNLFKQFWLGNQSMDFLCRRTRFEAPPRPNRPALDLPEQYIAAKFYAGTALPNSESNRRAIREIVGRLATRHPVVVLDTGLTVDEHQDYHLDGVAVTKAGFLALEFHRLYDTCDDDDYMIDVGGLRSTCTSRLLGYIPNWNDTKQVILL